MLRFWKNMDKRYLRFLLRRRIMAFCAAALYQRRLISPPPYMLFFLRLLCSRNWQMLRSGSLAIAWFCIFMLGSVYAQTGFCHGFAST